MSSTGWRPLAVTSKAIRGEYGHEASSLVELCSLLSWGTSRHANWDGSIN